MPLKDPSVWHSQQLVERKQPKNKNIKDGRGELIFAEFCVS